MAQDSVLREFFLGFIKIHILHHAGEAPVYGLALIEELREHGYDLSPGTLYPVLHQLQTAGFLRRVARVVDGKVRKYYALTPRGEIALTDARQKIAELVDEVLGPSPGARRQGRQPGGTARATGGRRPSPSPYQSHPPAVSQRRPQ